MIRNCESNGFAHLNKGTVDSYLKRNSLNPIVFADLLRSYRGIEVRRLARITYRFPGRGLMV